jgi:O-antigen/teichoic acid export membrane protein
MIKNFSILLFLRFVYVVLQLIFVKILTKGLSQSELGFYYFHLAVTIIYQVVFFTPFIINYQRRFLTINKNYNVIQYLRNHYLVIIIYFILFFLISLILTFKLSVFNLFLFCIYSFLIFKSTIVNTYFSLQNKTNLVYVISISELLLRNTFLYLYSNYLNLSVLIIIIVLINSITYYIYSKIFIKSDKFIHLNNNLKIQIFKSFLLFKCNINLIFSGSSNYIQNNLYKWILAFYEKFSLLGSISSVMGIGQQLETNLLNILHNTFLLRIINDRKFRNKFYFFIVMFTMLICGIIYLLMDVIILFFLNESFLPYSSFLFVAIIYELFNYILGNFSLIVVLDKKYFLNNLLGLIFSIVLYFIVSYFSELDIKTILYIFLLPTIFNLLLFFINSNGIKENPGIKQQ